MKGPNLQTQIKVIYKSGRAEIHKYSTAPKARREADRFRALPMVVKVRVLGKKVHRDFSEWCQERGI